MEHFPEGLKIFVSSAKAMNLKLDPMVTQSVTRPVTQSATQRATKPVLEPYGMRDLRLRHRKVVHGRDSACVDENLRTREKQKFFVLVINDLKLTLESSNQLVTAEAGDMLTFATAGSFNIESGLRSLSFIPSDSRGDAAREYSSIPVDGKSHVDTNIDCLVVVLESENLSRSFAIPEHTDVLHLRCKHAANRQINIDQFRLLQRKFQMPTSNDAVLKASIDRHLELLLIESFSEFFMQSNLGMGSDNSPLERIRHVVNKVIENPGHPWALDSMAEQANLSRSVFADRFKEVAGTSPYAFIRQERVKKAQFILQVTDSSLERVAEHCGYNSVSAFSKAFRTVTGISPGLFRKSLHKNIAEK